MAADGSEIVELNQLKQMYDNLNKKISDVQQSINSVKSGFNYQTVDVNPATNLQNYSWYVNSSFVTGNVVTLQYAIGLSKPTDWKSDTLLIGNIASTSCRPSSTIQRMRQLYVVSGSGGTNTFLRGFQVNTNGNIYFQNQASDTPEVSSVAILGISYFVSRTGALSLTDSIDPNFQVPNDILNQQFSDFTTKVNDHLL